ncbi:MAG: hypothetical protein II882_06755 [Lachnospiraceae bacterium]|nr:hypothetical protein [Lachnospiraceae bacterium]
MDLYPIPSVPAVEVFLTEAGMHPDCIREDEALLAFVSEMERGLEDASSSFPMLPTYLSTEGRLPSGKPVLVLDAGGTNLRIVLLHFEYNAAVIDDSLEMPVPGSLSPLTKDEYLSQMAKLLGPFAEKVDSVGYCFSYPAVILPDRDGQLERFNKGVCVSGSEGMHVCAELENALKEAGIPGSRRYVLLNDSAATVFGGLPQLSGKSFDGVYGFILGTGTNTCYSEAVSSIHRYDMSGFSGEMLINMESGAYDGFPMGVYDRAFHETDPQPYYHIFEKMISGAYFGKLCYLTAGGAAECGLFSPDFQSKLSDCPVFVTRDLSDFLADPAGQGKLASLCSSDSDRASLLSLISLLSYRSAKLAAVNLLAVPEHLNKGNTPDNPMLLIAEGSTFWRYPLFISYLTKYLKEWGEKKRGRYIHITAVRNANLIGSAAAALLNLP